MLRKWKANESMTAEKSICREGGREVGYVRLLVFSKNAPKDVAAALKDLQARPPLKPSLCTLPPSASDTEGP